MLMDRPNSDYSLFVKTIFFKSVADLIKAPELLIKTLEL